MTKVVRIITRLNIGGPSIHVTLLNAGLDPKRFQSMLICGSENDGEGSMLDYALTRGVDPIVIPGIVGDASFKLRDLRALFRLYSVLRKARPDIVHTHTAKAGFLGRIAARLARVPVVIHTYHGHVLHSYHGPLKTLLLRLMEFVLGRLSTRIIAISQQVKIDLIRYRIASPHKISVIPLGFDLIPFLVSSDQQGHFRHECSINRGTKLIGIIGRIAPIKNHFLFLAAAARVIEQYENCRFVIVGDGPTCVELQRHAAALGIAKKVIFAGWRRDLPRICADLDVLVVCSNNEGTPVAAIEAMAAGKPVVATRVGGLPDLIRDGETGVLVPPRDAVALADGILRVLLDDDMAARIGLAAREAVRDVYTAERLVEDTDSLYCQLLRKLPETGEITCSMRETAGQSG